MGGKVLHAAGVIEHAEVFGSTFGGFGGEGMDSGDNVGLWTR